MATRGDKRPIRPQWKSEQSRDAARALRQDSTAGESQLWNAVRGRALDGKKFRRQHPIEGFVVDFCCIEHRLVIEIDGQIHLASKATDREREEALRRAGYIVLRIPTHEVEERLPEVLNRIRDALKPSPPAPLPLAGEGRRQSG